MNLERIKFALLLANLQCMFLWLFSIFVVYDSESNAGNARNSFDPVYGGVSPDKNKLKRYYGSIKLPLKNLPN